ncbi:MAG TPA: XkdX family protein [Lachnospiraceae bacterium]|nr:XkdX family protein [Lachnospiraceae bacterium]
MTPFVESLKRLFKNKQISIERIKKLKEEKKISEEEFQYITT